MPVFGHNGHHSRACQQSSSKMKIIRAVLGHRRTSRPLTSRSEKTTLAPTRLRVGETRIRIMPPRNPLPHFLFPLLSFIVGVFFRFLWLTSYERINSHPSLIFSKRVDIPSLELHVLFFWGVVRWGLGFEDKFQRHRSRRPHLCRRLRLSVGSRVS